MPPNKIRYMKSTFSPRDYPQAIFLAPVDANDPRDDGDVIAGPFCVHCGNPLSMHSPKLRCPNRVLHPVFPGPACQCHGVRDGG